jgi:hypothetical protein
VLLARQTIRAVTESLDAELVMHVKNMILFVVSVELNWETFFMLHIYSIYIFLCDSPQWARASSFTRFLDHTRRRITVGRTPLDE